MKYLWIGLGIAVLLVLVVLLAVWLRKRWARKKVLDLSGEEKQRRLNSALSPFGFLYYPVDDTIGSRMNPWQREMGYCRTYDETAPSMNMVFECEPIYFSYMGRHYLIELWKGQYGCTTGAEIGIYVHREPSERPPEELFYECVEDEERLPMRFLLYKDGRVILARSGVHWWLTGFVVGMFSEPAELRMETGIGFPDKRMCLAFYEGLLHMGYARKNIRVEQNWVFFSFDRPVSPQPSYYPGWYLRLVNRVNRHNCRLYESVTKPFESALDRISYIGYCFPVLYRTIIRIGMRYRSNAERNVRRQSRSRRRAEKKRQRNQ